MKKIFVAFLLPLLLPFTMWAQKEREIIPVNWKEIKEVADKAPQRIKDLVARMSASKIDTTLTWNERILAYYGQSYLTPFTEFEEALDLDKLMNEKKYEQCLAGAKDLLKKNPMSLKGLYHAAFSISNILKNSKGPSKVTLDEGQVYYNRMQRILNTIAKTGDGTKEKPFYVTGVSDEYMFMRYYLDIWSIEKQSLVETFDVIDLKETSKYYSRKQICFEITRVLEIEMGLFNK